MKWQYWTLIAIFIITLAGGLIWSSTHYSGLYQTEKDRANKATALINQQNAVIAKQTFQFNRFNQIAAAAQQYNTKINGSSQEKQIEYRTFLKTEPTCALAVPSDVAGRLLDYANSLRANAVHADSGITDSAGADTSAAGTLTYCQAVLWIDPLLTAIDQANSQLAGIRQIEKTRASQ